MGIKERYLAYADAFERTFVDDDWSRIEPYFSADAVYESQERIEGRDAILENLRTSLDTFDRRMDGRALEFEAPTVEGDTVHVRWTASYTKAGAPDLVLEGTEAATFAGDRITRLQDVFRPETVKAMGEWMSAHGAKLQQG